MRPGVTRQREDTERVGSGAEPPTGRVPDHVPRPLGPVAMSRGGGATSPTPYRHTPAMTDFKAQGRRSRMKGKAYEQELVREAKRHRVDAYRILQSQGENLVGSDVVLGATRKHGVVERTGLRKIDVECKHRKTFSAPATAQITRRGVVVAVKVSGVKNGEYFAVPPELFWWMLETLQILKDGIVDEVDE